MTDIVLLTLISFSWIIFSWLVIYFPKKLRWYILPYLTFQLGATLIVYSISFVKGWSGIGYGGLGVAIVGIALILWLIVRIYYHSKPREASEEYDSF
ncbi:hypothetical protein [Pseudalkalibacillus salsuginis]|uniref:hypothetical protein n=1 Tax=Pseudalkalibacillus salsuginis TaxID=2910972 RepID=UPI001F323DCB|nr:hypothetical protein [Pseudalkalibacillus salsuginis]MCF6411452.1 hypothetical protein [Pseudalkalibacillus salsuginis]